MNVRGLGETLDPTVGSLTHAQNRGVLISGLVCASFSLVTALVALRWFLLMKKTFRHRLIFYLVLCDTFKAIWYFVFPVVIFVRGHLPSSSKFCQAGGFFLALSIDMSDFAILAIALHSILVIFGPTRKNGNSSGLYRYRKWIFPLWVGIPTLEASLAFVNRRHGYVTAGTFCYLPKRPFWYRLALSWVPRYIIIVTIFVMYAAVYIYVAIKFHGFKNLGDVASSNTTHDTPSPSGAQYETQSRDEDIELGPDEVGSSPSQRVLSPLYESGSPSPGPQLLTEPWDSMSFITTRPLQTNVMSKAGVQASDFAHDTISDPAETAVPSSNTSLSPEATTSTTDSRKVSAAPTTNTNFTGDTSVPRRNSWSRHGRLHKSQSDSPLERTRSAIRRQLRYMFIYPAVYVLMWAFPFASHCLLYSDYYVTHPVYWLTVVQTCMLALQAGVDCVIFSWREEPWRRISDESALSVPFWHNRSISIVKPSRGGSSTVAGSVTITAPPARTVPRQSPYWWEAEGRKRKDSVWLGLDRNNTRMTDRPDSKEGAQ